MYDEIVEGEANGDPYCNYTHFNVLTKGEKVRKAAHLARVAISDKYVSYKPSDRAWYIMDGKAEGEKLLGLKNSKEAEHKEEIFIDQVVNNNNIQSRLFSAMGESIDETCEDLRQLDHNTLKLRWKDFSGKHENKKKEELVELLCEKLDIEYTPV